MYFFPDFLLQVLDRDVAAERPDSNWISEHVCLQLSKEVILPRNGPKDIQEKTLTIPQLIMNIFTLNQQLVEGSLQVKTQSDLCTENNTTVSNW